MADRDKNIASKVAKQPKEVSVVMVSLCQFRGRNKDKRDYQKRGIEIRKQTISSLQTGFSAPVSSRMKHAKGSGSESLKDPEMPMYSSVADMQGIDRRALVSISLKAVGYKQTRLISVSLNLDLRSGTYQMIKRLLFTRSSNKKDDVTQIDIWPFFKREDGGCIILYESYQFDPRDSIRVTNVPDKESERKLAKLTG